MTIDKKIEFYKKIRDSLKKREEYSREYANECDRLVLISPVYSFKRVGYDYKTGFYWVLRNIASAKVNSLEKKKVK